ncbi:hypothetical protein D1871_16060 [Nakamurella silvestris]|nr:hypothetical protein D1871_16060 [Nakamurella silvestris]
MEGNYLCKTGSVYGTQCGIVTGVGLSINGVLHQGEVTFQTKGLNDYYGLTCVGDSGGPVITNHLGYGIVEGRGNPVPGSDAASGSTCSQIFFYQSLSRALSNMRGVLTCPTDKTLKITGPAC